MLPAANRLRRSGDIRATVRRGRRAGRDAVVVHARSCPPERSARPDALTGPRTSGSSTQVPTSKQVITPPQATKPTQATKPPQVAFVVSKAVGGAVVRNAVARRLRAAMAARLTRLPADSQWVVRALPPAATASWASMGAQVDAALDRLIPLGPRAGR